MGAYFQYTGVGGLYNGTGLPAGGVIGTAEKVICQTPVPDNREPIQGGVLITAQVTFGAATTTFATLQCRQSTLGTSTAVAGTASSTATSTPRSTTLDANLTSIWMSRA